MNMRVHGRGGAGGSGATPITHYTSPYEVGPHVVLTANTLLLIAAVIPASVTFANIAFHVGIADGVNNSDFGIYNAAGALLANAGAQAMGSATFSSFAAVQGSQTIAAGLYFIAWTSAGSVLGVSYDTYCTGFYYNASFGVSVGGALPASITPPALALNGNNASFALS